MSPSAGAARMLQSYYSDWSLTSFIAHLANLILLLPKLSYVRVRNGTLNHKSEAEGKENVCSWQSLFSKLIFSIKQYYFLVIRESYKIIIQRGNGSRMSARPLLQSLQCSECLNNPGHAIQWTFDIHYIKLENHLTLCSMKAELFPVHFPKLTFYSSPFILAVIIPIVE